MINTINTINKMDTSSYEPQFKDSPYLYHIFPSSHITYIPIFTYERAYKFTWVRLIYMYCAGAANLQLLIIMSSDSSTMPQISSNSLPNEGDSLLNVGDSLQLLTGLQGEGVPSQIKAEQCVSSDSSGSLQELEILDDQLPIHIHKEASLQFGQSSLQFHTVPIRVHSSDCSAPLTASPIHSPSQIQQSNSIPPQARIDHTVVIKLIDDPAERNHQGSNKHEEKDNEGRNNEGRDSGQTSIKKVQIPFELQANKVLQTQVSQLQPICQQQQRQEVRAEKTKDNFSIQMTVQDCSQPDATPQPQSQTKSISTSPDRIWKTHTRCSNLSEVPYARLCSPAPIVSSVWISQPLPVFPGSASVLLSPPLRRQITLAPKLVADGSGRIVIRSSGHPAHKFLLVLFGLLLLSIMITVIWGVMK